MTLTTASDRPMTVRRNTEACLQETTLASPTFASWVITEAF